MQAQAIKRDRYVETEIIRIGGLQGQESAERLNAVLTAVEGVQEVTVTLDDSKAVVVYAPDLTSRQLLRRAVDGAGYEAIKPVHGEDGSCCGGCGG